MSVWKRNAVFVLACVAMQTWAGGSPFLWRIETAGAKPSYLFGSIHIPTPAVTNLAPCVERALQSTDAVYCELAFEPETLMKIGQASMNARRPLSQVLPADVYTRAEAELGRIVPGFKLAAIERAEVWVLMAELVMLDYQVKYPSVPALDLLLFQRAQAAGKETGGLETAEEQLGAMAAFTDAEQIEMLRSTLDEMQDLRKKGQDAVQLLLDAYLSGDAAALDREVDRSYATCTPALRKRFEQLLLVERNRRMADRIAKRIRTQPGKSTLFVIGTLHGLGQGSVVDLLAKSGLTVERVKP